MNLHFRLLALVALATFASDAAAQRGRARGRGRGGAPSAPPAAPAEVPPPAKVEKWTAITGGDVHIGDGRVLRGATVLLGDDRIHAVGHDVTIPEGATVVRADGKVVAPGYVAARAQGLGLSSSVTGEVKDAINPFDPSIKRGLAAGITSYLYVSGGGQGTPSGTSALVKLAYGDAKSMVRKTACSYVMRVPLSPSEWARLRELVAKAKEHVAASEASPPSRPTAAAGGPPASSGRGSFGRSAGGGSSRPQAPAGTEELVRILRGEARLWVRLGGGGGGRRGGGGGDDDGADDRDEIRQACRIAELLGTGVVLDDPVTGWLLADEIATTNSMVLLNPRRSVAPDPTLPDETGSNMAAARILQEAGVPVAVTCPSGRFGGAQVGTGGILGQDLNTPQVDAAYAIRGGLDPRHALATLTLDAARLAGVESCVGSLEPGKDADVLILDGDPLSYRTFVETALVNGKVVYEKAKESYYQHIRR
ncbi:MAG: amidohydrolase family protein [Planctomycetota bacterium]